MREIEDHRAMVLIFYYHFQPMDPFKMQTFSYLTLLLLPLLAYLIKHVIKKPRFKLPPGPWPLPLIGNLHHLGSLPHRSLGLLSKKYGPLLYLRLGRIPTLVVSSAEIAEEVLHTHDLAFCTRPPLIALKKLSYGGLDMAFAAYSERWRQLRKISTVELLSSKRIQAFRAVREDEVALLVKTIFKYYALGPVNLSEMILCLANNITCRQVFGKRFSEEGECGRSKYHELVTESIALMGGFCAGDFFPSLEWLNILTGWKKRLDKNFLEMDAFLEEIVEECRCNYHIRLEHKDFVSVLLRHQMESTLGISLSNDHIKAILMDMFIAGTDTSASIIVWGMTELMRNPNAMKKAQNEVRTVIGMKERVEESDLQKLEYLKLVVKEILRFHPPGPLLLPRECREECVIGGYKIPKKTRVHINAWAIGRDPKYWENPNEFSPERFKDNRVDYKGQDFQFIPFGSGRRICPGISSGALVIELALANLLHVFDWDLPVGMTLADLDVAETFGVVVHKKSPLLLLPTPITITTSP